MVVVSYGGAALDDAKIYYIQPADLYTADSIACKDNPKGLVLSALTLDGPMVCKSATYWKNTGYWNEQQLGYRVLHGTDARAGRSFSFQLVGLYNGDPAKQNQPLYIEATGTAVDPRRDVGGANRFEECRLRLSLARTSATFFSAVASGTVSGRQAITIRCDGDDEAGPVSFWGVTAFADFSDQRTSMNSSYNNIGAAVYAEACYPRLIPTKTPLGNQLAPFKATDEVIYLNRSTKPRFVLTDALP